MLVEYVNVPWGEPKWTSASENARLSAARSRSAVAKVVFGGQTPEAASEAASMTGLRLRHAATPAFSRPMAWIPIAVRPMAHVLAAPRDPAGADD